MRTRRIGLRDAHAEMLAVPLKELRRQASRPLRSFQLDIRRPFHHAEMQAGDVFADDAEREQLRGAAPPRARHDAAEHCPGECIYVEWEVPTAPDDEDADIQDADVIVGSG